MKLAIPIWEGRVSSVFDFAHEVLLVELMGNRESGRDQVILSGQGPARILSLRRLGVDTLICGAISRPLASWTSVYGVRLFPYVTGVVEDVIKAFKNGQLGSEQFVLPGSWQGLRMGSRHCCDRRGRNYGPRS